MSPMDRLLAHLRLTAEASQSAKDRAVLDSGLTKAQYNALLMLRHSGEATASQLARDFITSQPSPHGGRALVLRLTDRGERSLVTADERVRLLEQSLQDAVTPTRVDDLLTTLDRIREAAALYD